MEHITKVFFDPLVATKAQVRALLQDLPVGSAHPFSPERLLLCRTATGIDEINISSYPENHFFNAVDLGALGQTLQTRMAKFSHNLRVFNDEYTVQQAPSAIFEVPITSNEIAILAVSERYPTYYDFCVAEADCKTMCYGARSTFTGMQHSGDINEGTDLLHHIKIDERLEAGKEFAVFVSGFQYTKLTRFQERNPVVMVANHAEKALYIVPVPLDAASIGDATICTPLVVKREGAMLICCILPTPTTDIDKMCSGSSLQSTSFRDAIGRAEWTVAASVTAPELPTYTSLPAPASVSAPTSSTERLSLISSKQNAVFITQTTTLPSLIELSASQVIRFGKGLDFIYDEDQFAPASDASAVILPCIFGSRLEGPLLLATGQAADNPPFSDEKSLRACYENFENVIVFVDERMTDNARNLATPWRMNAVFILQMTLDATATDSEITALLNLVNINSITALAGPQSLIIVQISEKYYFYRGLANRVHLNTSTLAYGADITECIRSTGLQSLLDPRVKRIMNLNEENDVLLPASGQVAQPQKLETLFGNLSLDQIRDLEDDIAAIVPQLQVLLKQKDLVDLSRLLISILSKKVGDGTAPLRDAYIKFMSKEYNIDDVESVKKKNLMLSELRKNNKQLQTSLETAISLLSNMMSSQTTSKRTHDLKRLERQAAIHNNVEAVKSMTFESLAGLLESKAADMGVLLLNVDTEPYKKVLQSLKSDNLDVESSCDLDDRVLYLEGFDAGIIIEQSQSSHDGPLKHQFGASHPILALPYLSQERGTGSMLAWVCWDEFVNLKSPFKVRWMEKCNEPHIAAFRIVMRDTLSQAVVSREHNLQPGAPEIGQLMSALLKAAMSKLAAKRNTAPTQTITVEDTITKLMRGLFGNLLTTAGSGVRPMSMVWQLFGLEPKFEVPATPIAWSWYENVVRLYPFTGWPKEQFNVNLGRLLDKALISIVTKNEQTETLKASRAEMLAEYCKLRNIQLAHSRTIITIFMRMMDTDSDIKAIAARILAALPTSLAKQTSSYTKMINYLEHLESKGSRREADDVVIASVFLKRSAAFKDIKEAAAKTCTDRDNDTIKNSCLAVLGQFYTIAESWGLSKSKLTMQNAKAYQGLVDTHLENEDEYDEDTKTTRKKLMDQVIGDAEKGRMPWQVGKEGQFGDNIEPLDEKFLREILTGEEESDEILITDPSAVITKDAPLEGMKRFASLVKPEFITKIEKQLTPEDVCRIMNIPVSTMRVFATALNPAFEWEKDLVLNFKAVVISLLAERKEREKQHPIWKLFGMSKKALDQGMVDEGVADVL